MLSALITVLFEIIAYPRLQFKPAGSTGKIVGHGVGVHKSPCILARKPCYFCYYRNIVAGGDEFLLLAGYELVFKVF